MDMMLKLIDHQIIIYWFWAGKRRKMKKILTVSLISLSLIATPVHAKWSHALIGAGVGYMIGSSGSRGMSQSDCENQCNSRVSQVMSQYKLNLAEYVRRSKKTKFTKDEVLDLIYMEK
jgi:hypothetical protein